MGSRTDFEIRPVPGGYAIYAAVAYWAQPDQIRVTRGLINPTPFSTEMVTKAWLYEQYSLPPEGWVRAADQSLRQGKGDPLPIPKTSD
jgi:hypothetical protein